MFPKFIAVPNQYASNVVIAGLTRNPWMPAQVRHDSLSFWASHQALAQLIRPHQAIHQQGRAFG